MKDERKNYIMSNDEHETTFRKAEEFSKVNDLVCKLFQNAVEFQNKESTAKYDTRIHIIQIEDNSIYYNITCYKDGYINKDFTSFIIETLELLNGVKQTEELKEYLNYQQPYYKQLQESGINHISFKVDNDSINIHFENRKIIPNDIDFSEEKMHKKIQRGLDYLHNIMEEIHAIVGNTANHDLYFQNPKFVFRGITKFYPDIEHDWKKCELAQVKEDNIKSSLAVRLRDTSKDFIKNGNYTRAYYVNALEDIIRKAKNMYPNKYPADMSDLDILADIQHNGGATCLVDFSKNLLTSIWFACNADPKDNGYIYCYNIMEDMIERDRLTIIRPEDENRKISELLAQTYRETNVCSDVETRFCLWEPSKKNTRMFRQDSVFVFGIEKFNVNDHAINVIEIKAEWKSAILTTMKIIFNISGSSVYNDYIGFANNINKLRPYRKMLDSAYTRGYANMIKGNYASALDFLKLAEIECYKLPDEMQKRRWDDKQRLELHFSLGVCYKNLARQNEKIHYLENAIQEYKKVVNYAKGLHIETERQNILTKNQKEDIEYYRHKTIRAYNAIITLLYKLERYNDAINTCTDIIATIKEWKLNNVSLTSKYCEISILELRNLASIKNCLDAKKIIEQINITKEKSKTFDVESYKKQIKHPFNFFVLLEEYYNQVAEIINNKAHLEDVESIISVWYDNAEKYFEESDTKENDYILWNFTDIKNKIDAINKDSDIYKQKTALQDLTAGVIALRDLYEMHGWWSVDQV